MLGRSIIHQCNRLSNMIQLTVCYVLGLFNEEGVAMTWKNWCQITTRLDIM